MSAKPLGFSCSRILEPGRLPPIYKSQGAGWTGAALWKLVAEEKALDPLEVGNAESWDDVAARMLHGQGQPLRECPNKPLGAHFGRVAGAPYVDRGVASPGSLPTAAFEEGAMAPMPRAKAPDEHREPR